MLTPDRWQTYASLFDECGFEVYETIGHVSVQMEEKKPIDSVRIRGILQLRELEERLRQQLYTVQDMMEENIQEEDHRAGVVEN